MSMWSVDVRKGLGTARRSAAGSSIGSKARNHRNPLSPTHLPTPVPSDEIRAPRGSRDDHRPKRYDHRTSVVHVDRTPPKPPCDRRSMLVGRGIKTIFSYWRSMIRRGAADFRGGW